MGSHDLEDLIAVVDGRAEIVDVLRGAASDVRTSVVSAVQALVERRDLDLIDALPGVLLPDAASQASVRVVVDRVRREGT